MAQTTQLTAPHFVFTDLFSLIGAYSHVKAILDAAITNMDVKVTLQRELPQVVPYLEQIGEKLFPKVAPEMRVVAAAVASYDPNGTMWLQKSLNVLFHNGKIKLAEPLELDGVYGAKTRDAVEALQVSLNIKPDGWMGQITQAAIRGAIALLETKNGNAQQRV